VLPDLGKDSLMSGVYYDISVGNVLRVKQLIRLPSNEAPEISSNPDFFDYSAKVSDIKILGRVVWFVRGLT
jgi:phage repressor protein C with HTH and peptisase S24 domain